MAKRKKKKPELTLKTPIMDVDPDGSLRARYAAFGEQAKKWDDGVLQICLEDLERRFQDGKESGDDHYMRQQLVRHHLIRMVLEA